MEISNMYNGRNALTRFGNECQFLRFGLNTSVLTILNEMELLSGLKRPHSRLENRSSVLQ